jgi:hypothetical protein
MTLADPARVEFDPVTAALVFEEVAQARDWWLRRLKLLRAIRLNLGDETEEEAELVLKVERLTEAARRIRVALYGDPSLGDGDHFAGMPEPREPGIYALRVVGQQRP